MTLGAKYLTEYNYEEAVIAFTAAIEIAPRFTDAYIGRANAYIGMASARKAVTGLNWNSGIPVRKMTI